MAKRKTAAAGGDLIAMFEEYLRSVIDAKGFYPHPCMSRADGDRITVAALTDPNAAMGWFCMLLGDPSTVEVIFGLDRTTREDQGTEFADVLTCVHWRRGEGWRVGVVNYRWEPLTIRPIDWGNEFWRKQMGDEVGHVLAGGRLRVFAESRIERVENN